MPNFRLSCILFLIIGFPFLGHSQNLLIQNVQLVDVKTGIIVSNQDVFIENGYIRMVGKDLPSIPGNESETIDGTGKFLLPGLFDMHTHFGSDTWLAMYLHYGITGIRVMAGNDRLLALKDSINQEIKPNPQLYIVSNLIDGNPPLWGEQHTGPIVESNTDLIPILDELTQKGYRELKVYNRIPRSKYQELLAYAAENKLKVSGHIPYTLEEKDYADPRHHSIEHLDGLVQFAKPNFYRWDSIGIEELQRTSLYQELNMEDFGSLSTRIKSNEIWICPTLSLYGNLVNEEIRGIIARNSFKQELAGLFGFWKSMERLKNDFNLKYSVHREILNRHFLDYADHILAGTDSPNPYNPPGQALHFELMHLSMAGLSNAQILKIATLNAARYLGMDQVLGSIEVGKIADLVLLKENPLECIRATQTIDQVFKNGIPVLTEPIHEN